MSLSHHPESLGHSRALRLVGQEGGRDSVGLLVTL